MAGGAVFAFPPCMRTMRIHRFTIGGGRLFDLPDAAAVRVRCTAGSLWITLDHEPRDIVLVPGESFSTPDHRRARSTPSRRRASNFAADRPQARARPCAPATA